MSCRKVGVAAASVADGWKRAALKREQLASGRINDYYDRLANSPEFWIVPPDLDQREVTESIFIMGRSVQSHHSHQQCGILDPMASHIEDDGGTPRQTSAIPGGLLETSSLKERAV